MDGIGTKIDAHAKRVFHEPEVFIASPEQGLQIGGDLQSDLQGFRWPPVQRGEVEQSRVRLVERSNKARNTRATRTAGCGQEVD
jgi:hypothetical protein